MPQDKYEDLEASASIIISEFGDKLIFCCGNAEKLSQFGVVGRHENCTRIKGKKISDTHFVLFCEDCCLRIPIPVSVDSYEKLREYFILKGIEQNAQ